MTDRLDELDRQVQRGSLFTQAIMQRTSQRVSAAEAILAKVIDGLAEKGVLDPSDLGLVAEGGEPSPDDAPPGDELPELPSLTITWPAVAIREDPVDASNAAPASVDCEARMPVCQAVCCRLKFPLSAAEVEAGSIRWDIGHPYLIRHESDGWCAHNDRSTRGCTKYEDRPTVCRTYSCVEDARIWSDFDNMVLNRSWIDEHLTPNDGMYFEAVAASMEVPVRLKEKRR